MTTVTVIPGQVWEDKDPRGPRRRVVVLELHNGYALVKNIRTNREGRIRLDRFVPTRQTGYILVDDPQGPRTNEMCWCASGGKCPLHKSEEKGVFCLEHRKVMVDGVCPKCPRVEA